MKQKTTFRGIVGSVLFIFAALSSLSTSAQTIILTEDFASANAAGSNNTSTSGQSTLWPGNSNFTVDANSKAYQAGGAVKLGTGSAIGYITSIPLDLSQNGGNFTVTFDVKGWTLVEGQIKVTVTSPTSAMDQTVVYTATMSGAFENKVLTFSGGMANSTVRIETTAKRAFIDNVVIATVGTTCPDVAEPVVTAQAFCGSATASQLTAAGTNLQWFTTATGETTLNPTDALATGTYYVSQTVDGCESDLVPVSVTVNAIPNAPEAAPQAVCNEGLVSQLAANGTDLQWYTAATGGDALAPGDELATATYYVSQTVNGCESTRTAVQITVNSVGAPDALNIQTFCNGATVEELDAVGTAVLWYTSAEGGTALNPADAVSDGVYYASQTIEGCESERTSVSVDVIVVDMPQGAATQQFTAGQTIQNLQITGSNIVWYADAALTTVIPTSTALADGVTYYAVATQGTCTSGALAVTVDETLGTGAYTMAGLKFYPNPVNNVLTVEYGNTLSSIVVHNLLGQTVLTKKANSQSAIIDVSSLTAGAYLVTISSGSESRTIRIIKQ